MRSGLTGRIVAAGAILLLPGTDMILLTGSEASTANAYATLLRDATDGTISRATLRASYDRILALKAGLG